MKEFGRLITAMVTPFDAQGKVDYQQAKNLARSLLDSGSDGLVVCGTTGEAPTLSVDEKLQMFAEVKSAIGNRGAVIAGTGNYNTRESQELTREAEKLGVDACLLTVPYYNRPTQEGLIEHFTAIARVTSLPCILYNVPSRTATNLAADSVIKLSQVDNIIGVKEASGNFRQIATIIQGTGDGFFVYSGNDGDTLLVLALGGYGLVSVAAHLSGPRIREMIDKFLQAKNQEAADIHRHLLPLVDALFIVANPIPLKYALNYLGFPVGKPRLPLVEPDEKSAAIIRETLERYKGELAVPSMGD